ncbi:MAG: 50S ribosome-binding GTPase, partial [Oligoflexia bacterium]|nr:50S ribosome-binding GTPase [Oligoflexia bacterium]
MFLYQDDPIIAISTSNASNAAIAVLRISGFNDILDFQHFFSIDLKKIISRKVYLCDLLDRDKNKIIDRALLVYFKSPNSYTGENVIEISVHGNKLNTQRVLNLFVEKFSELRPSLLRLAYAGEFTYRALKNKKLTLSEVEGLDLILNASVPYVLEHGQSVLRGELHKNYELLHELFLNLRMSIELNIDFSEDVGDIEAFQYLNTAFENYFFHIETLYSRTRGFDQGILSPEVVLFGPVNAGKSTLFNSLLKINRSIVSEVPGTTRDYVSEIISIEGINFRLIDTAGLRDKSVKMLDEAENEGIKRSLDLINNSFMRILVINPFLDTVLSCEKEIDLIVFTHNDLEGHNEVMNNFLDKNINNNGSIKCKKIISGPIGPLEKTQTPLSTILECIKNKYDFLLADNPILIERHRDQIKKNFDLAVKIKKMIENKEEVAILASEITILGNLISELIGVVKVD